jgi:chorismate mutase
LIPAALGFLLKYQYIIFLKMDDLATFRKQIDALDESILDLLRQRFEITRKVGEFKAMHRLLPVDKAREELKFASLAASSAAKGLDPDLVQRVYRLIIDKVVGEHEKIAAGGGAQWG